MEPYKKNSLFPESSITFLRVLSVGAIPPGSPHRASIRREVVNFQSLFHVLKVFLYSGQLRIWISKIHQLFKKLLILIYLKNTLVLSYNMSFHPQSSCIEVLPWCISCREPFTTYLYPSFRAPFDPVCALFIFSSVYCLTLGFCHSSKFPYYCFDVFICGVLRGIPLFFMHNSCPYYCVINFTPFACIYTLWFCPMSFSCYIPSLRSSNVLFLQCFCLQLAWCPYLWIVI